MSDDEIRDVALKMTPELHKIVDKNMRQLDGMIERGDALGIHMVREIMESNAHFMFICTMTRIFIRHCEYEQV